MRSRFKVVLLFALVGVLLGFTQMSTVSAVSTSNPSFFDILANGDLTFIGAGSTTKMIVIGAPDFVSAVERNAYAIDSFTGHLTVVAAFHRMFAPIDIPDGATITEFECIVFDGHPTKNVACSLYEAIHGLSIPTTITTLSTSGTTGTQTLTSSPLSTLVDRDSKRYYTDFFVGFGGSESCGACALISMKITYTVPSGMIVGGEFYPVDNVSLLLAYGLVNSWWMAPIGIGVGVGVYLVKRKF